MAPTEVFVNQKKILLYLALAILFLFYGYYRMVHPRHYTTSISPTIGYIRGALVIIASIALFSFIGPLLFRRKAVLVIDDLGLQNNMQRNYPYYLPWSDVEELKLIPLRRKQIIGVKLKSPQQFIDSKASPVIIPELLDTPCDKLYALMNQYITAQSNTKNNLYGNAT
jgi:hypothetical protein